MRTWRVGSFSMGLSILFLGVALLLTQIFQLKTATILLAWWPVIFIVLGIEILAYLYFSKQEKSIVKYDFLSIVFVGFIGMAGIGLTILATTGILDKVNEWANMEIKTMNLPEYGNPIQEDITRVVVNTGSHAITVEDSASDKVSIFGTYRAQTYGKEAAITSANDYLLTKEEGDTLYIALKEIYNLPQPFQDRVELKPTILVPSNVNVEVNGQFNSLTLKPRSLASNWIINKVSDVDVRLADAADILIKARDVHELDGNGWENNLNEKKSQEDPPTSGMMKVGDGKNILSIQDAQVVSVSKP